MQVETKEALESFIDQALITEVLYPLQSGALPPGLSLDAGTGTFSGTPTQDGMFTFTIQAADSFNTAAQAYDLQIYPAPPPNPQSSDSTSASGCTTGTSPGSRLAALVATLAALAMARKRALRQPARRA
jgi:hypothetical protein